MRDALVVGNGTGTETRRFGLYDRWRTVHERQEAHPMQSKLTTLSAAVAAIPDGAVIALGGNTIHRGPGAAVHEIVRQRKSGLNVVKTAGAYDIDLLCAMGCASVVSAGYVGYESVFGLAPSYRRAVESG